MTKNNLLRLLAFLFVIAAYTNEIKAQAFSCDPKMYLSQSNILYEINTTTKPFTYTPIATLPSSISTGMNALGYNPITNLMYTVTEGATPRLIRINNASPTITFTNIAALSGVYISSPTSVGSEYNTGDFDSSGRYFIKHYQNNGYFYRVNLATGAATAITLNQNCHPADITFNRVDGKFYGVDRDTGQLFTILVNNATNTGTVTFIGATQSAVDFGAMMSTNSGRIFGVNNVGGFYEFNKTTGARTQISTANASTSNDATNCMLSEPIFPVDLSITKSDGSPTYTAGSSTTYTVVAANSTLYYGVVNATVTDALPSGIPAANMSYTATASSGSTTNVSGTQTGAINDLVSLPPGGTVTYKVTITIPTTYTGNLTNIATIATSSSTTSPDNNLLNNSATDIDINYCEISDSNPDSDGDSIANACDNDDDNDGILDTNEMACSSGNFVDYGSAYNNTLTSLNGLVTNTTISGVTVTNTASGTYTTFQANFSAGEPFARTSAANNVNSPSILQFDFNKAISNYAVTVYDVDVVTTTHKEAVKIEAYYQGVLLTPTSKVLGAEIVLDEATFGTGYYTGTDDVGNFTDAAGAMTYDYQNQLVDKVIIYHKVLGSVITVGILHKAGCTDKDTDGDGIIDRLDLDSDNDGCLDAIEGSGSFTSGDLTTHPGTGIGIGTGSPALAPLNFGTAVVLNAGSPLLGVPTAVGTGQTVGDSTNSLAVTCATTPFTCNSTMYISGTNPSNGIYTYNNATNPATKTLVGSPATVSINAIGYNTNDNYIYGIVGSGPDTNKYLYKVDGNGVFYNLGLLPELYSSGTMVAGDFADDGYLYVRQGTNSITFFRINVATRAVTTITMTEGGVPLTNFNTADFAYSGGKFWTIDYISPIRLASFTTAGVVEHKSYVFASAPGYGAMFADSNGNIFGTVANPSATAKFVQFNTTTGTTTTISDAVSTGSLDGAHCLNAPINFATDLSVTKDDGITQYTAGTTNTYTIKVTNNGPFGATNVNFTDTLPTGITAANIVSIVTANGATTSLTAGATSGAAINDIINLSAPTDSNSDGIFDVFSSITYTITIDVPSTYTGDFTNTATVTFPTGSSFSDTDNSNNTAVDTDTGVCYEDAAIGTGDLSTIHGITLLKRAGADNGNWPMIRNSAFTALESNSKGFVITRMESPETSIGTNAVEGMMVYDIDQQCLKIYSDGEWSCFTTPACP